MIDPNLFTVKRLLARMLDTNGGNINKWWALCEIVPDYKAPFDKSNDKPRCVVRCRNPNLDYDHFLRGFQGPTQGHFWDIYGDNYITPEYALMALLSAPIPPSFIDLDVWRAASNADKLAKF